MNKMANESLLVLEQLTRTLNTIFRRHVLCDVTKLATLCGDVIIGVIKLYDIISDRPLRFYYTQLKNSIRA